MTGGETAFVPLSDTATRVTPPLPSKEVLERVQLERYRFDWLVRTGSVPFEDVRRGGNPPDFEVRRGDSWRRLDCAALAVEEKRKAEARFTKFVRRLAAADRSFAHLADTHVTLWFGHSSRLPPGARDESLDAEVADALARFRVYREAIATMNREIAAHGFPETMRPELKPFTAENSASTSLQSTGGSPTAPNPPGSASPFR
jgi:hypothetical protein